MAWWNYRKPVARRIGVELFPDAMAIASGSETTSGFAVDKVALIPCAADQREQLLTEFVNENRYHKARCSLVLSPGDYQLLLVEAPQVPVEELRAAMRWRLRDLLDFPLETAVIDTCDLPSDAARGGKRMLFAVAAETQLVEQRLQLISAAGLEPSVVDISEMAMRNLTQCLPAEELDARGVVLVRLRLGGGSLGLYRGGSLYLSRHFDLNYGGGLLDDLPADALVLEIQRSVDYAERQMGQAPPAAIYICGDNISEDKITDSIRNGLAAPVRLLEMRGLEAKAVAADQEESVMQTCAGAIGAVLRREEWV